MKRVRRVKEGKGLQSCGCLCAGGIVNVKGEKGSEEVDMYAGQTKGGCR